jgi:hypothetical protein
MNLNSTELIFDFTLGTNFGENRPKNLNSWFKKATELTTMVNWGTGSPTENCFLTTYHPSYMVH